jgi:arylsulfatase A-like enzyme
MKKHSQKVFVLMAIILAVSAGVGFIVLKAKKTNQFNIILISIDTLRADHLGCYYYPRGTSPAIDRFRTGAVLFRHCMAQAPSTLASHASLLTSLILSHHGAYFTRSQPLPDKVQTMAERLQQRNYRTISFNDGGQIAPEFGLNQGFEKYESMGAKIKINELNFRRIVNKTIQWLDQNPREKFFLFLHTYETHHPYTPAEYYLNLFEANYNGNLPRHIPVELIVQINQGKINLDKDDQQHIINTYDAEIRSMDDSFGLLMAYLQKKKLYDNTLIIFTSDHGEEFGEHGSWAIHSHTLFNDQLHVPLIIKLPGSAPAPGKVDYLVRSIDVLPTVMDLLGEKAAAGMEGTSLVPLMKGRPPKKPVLAISQRDMQTTYDPAYWSVMTRKWKLYDNRLYNLLQDPGEMKDVSAANPDLKKELENYALRYLKRKKTKFPPKKITLDRDLKEKLKTLGYLE